MGKNLSIVLPACVILGVEVVVAVVRVALWACAIALGVAIVIVTLNALLGPGWGIS